MSANAGSLADLQRAFQAFMLAGDTGFATKVRSGGRASREIGLAVYRDGYALRLIEALEIDYPGLMAMAGPADFELMARAYIAAHPSCHPSVRWFGRHLAAFLAATPPFSATPAAAEMARFEWALGEAFDAADTIPIDADALMSLASDSWPGLMLDPVPSFRRLTLAYAIPQAWAVREQAPPGELGVDPADRPTPWAIWRADETSTYRSLAPDEAALLDALAAGGTFLDMVGAVAPHTGEDEAPARTATTLRLFVEDGMIARFRLSD